LRTRFDFFIKEGISFKGVIPAKAGIQLRNTGFPRIKYGAGSVKPEMTIKGKGFMNALHWQFYVSDV